MKSAPSSHQNKNETIFSYHTYFHNHMSLSNFKCTELRQIAKHQGLTQVGTKAQLVDKIHTFFLRNARATTIQRNLRGRWSRQFMSPALRGSAFYDRSKCVNDCDFYTMDPLADIPAIRFFSYTDTKNFTYGFDIHSLVIYRNKGNTVNPYNRTDIPKEVHAQLRRLYGLMRMVCPYAILENEKEYGVHEVPEGIFRRRRRRGQRRILTITHEVHPTTFAVHPTRPVILVNRYQNDTVRVLANSQTMVAITTALDARAAMIHQIRQKPVATRIMELFMEIDLLGNYTSASWFSDLNVTGLHAFYRQLMDIWRFMAHIPFDVKHRICPLEDPFSPSPAEAGNDRNLDFMQKLCLHAMEHMVFSGLDMEYRKLGAMHVLTALTVVSLPCRNTMFWLYETLF
jgi:hypothetical protein